MLNIFLLKSQKNKYKHISIAPPIILSRLHHTFSPLSFSSFTCRRFEDRTSAPRSVVCANETLRYCPR